jgi:hypothetical protein
MEEEEPRNGEKEKESEGKYATENVTNFWIVTNSKVEHSSLIPYHERRK